MLSPEKSRSLLLASALAFGASLTSPGFAKTTPSRLVSKAVRTIDEKITFAGLEENTAVYEKTLRSVDVGSECFSIPVGKSAKLHLLFQHCSDEAFKIDGEGVQLTDQFSVPEGLSRRYNFWRRVYSHWSKDQWVMHLSGWPEVVVEILDSSILPASTPPLARERIVKSEGKDRRDTYGKLFRAMHRLRKTPDAFTPAMQRLARTMTHIKDDDKYLKASNMLRLQRGQRDFIALGLAVAPRYLPAIERELAAQKVPLEIAKLAFVESSFNAKARSKVGASGIFQLMPETGRQFMIVQGDIDERNDPIKAARAAAKLLNQYHRLTGSWPLAITAYNHGIGGIKRAKQSVGSSELVNLIDNHRAPSFGFASKNFYASFLGMVATLSQAHILFPEVKDQKPLAFEKVTMRGATSIATVKKKYRLSNATILEYNLDLSRSLVLGEGTLPSGYVLKIPATATAPAATLTVAHDPNS